MTVMLNDVTVETKLNQSNNNQQQQPSNLANAKKAGNTSKVAQEPKSQWDSFGATGNGNDAPNTQALTNNGNNTSATNQAIPATNDNDMVSGEGYNGTGDDGDDGNYDVETIFDPEIARLEKKLDTLTKLREMESRRLFLPTRNYTNTGNSSGNSEEIALAESSEEAEGLLVPLSDDEVDSLLAVYQEHQHQQQANNDGNNNQQNAKASEDIGVSIIQRLIEVASSENEEATDPAVRGAVSLLKQLENHPIAKGLIQGYEQQQREAEETALFANFGLTSATTANVATTSNTNAAELSIDNGGNNPAGVAAGTSNNNNVRRAGNPKRQQATAAVTNGDSSEPQVNNTTDTTTEAANNKPELAPYALPLLRLKKLAQRMATAAAPTNGERLVIVLPKSEAAYHFNHLVHSRINRLSLSLSRVLAGIVPMAILSVLCVIFWLGGPVLAIVNGSAATNNNNKTTDNGTATALQQLPNQPQLVVQLLLTPAAISTDTTAQSVVTTAPVSNNTVGAVSAATTLAPTPTQQQAVLTNNPHGSFSAPSRLEIPGLDFAASVNKADVTVQDNGFVQVRWPDGTIKDQIGQYGAYPGENGNMVLIGDWKALGIASQLQVNDYITVYNRNGSSYTYQIIQIAPDNQPEAVVGCGNSDFLIGNNTGSGANSDNSTIPNAQSSTTGQTTANNNTAYLTLVIPYLSDSDVAATATAQAVIPNSNNSYRSNSSSGNSNLSLPVTPQQQQMSPTPSALSIATVAPNSSMPTVQPVKCTPVNGSNFSSGTQPDATGDPHYLVRVWRAVLVGRAPKPAPTIGTPVASLTAAATPKKVTAVATSGGGVITTTQAALLTTTPTPNNGK